MRLLCRSPSNAMSTPVAKREVRLSMLLLFLSTRRSRIQHLVWLPQSCLHLHLFFSTCSAAIFTFGISSLALLTVFQGSNPSLHRSYSFFACGSFQHAQACLQKPFSSPWTFTSIVHVPFSHSRPIFSHLLTSSVVENVAAKSPRLEYHGISGTNYRRHCS